MPSPVRLLDPPARSFPDCQEGPDLDADIAEVANALEAHMAAMNAGSLFLDPTALRRLRTCATKALRVAVAYHRLVGPCGYRCRFPGLHCPNREPLEAVIDDLTAHGWLAWHDRAGEQAAGAVTCVCGAAMAFSGLRRGRERRSWAACGDCGHWVAL